MVLIPPIVMPAPIAIPGNAMLFPY